MKVFLEKIAKEAGEILFRRFRTELQIQKKADSSLVTEVDKQVETLLLKRIKHKFPTHSILSEESGRHENEKEYLWVIDPLDGTTNFAHGFPWFCVSIGLLHHGKLKFGLIYNPLVKELFYAEKGKGAYLNGKRIHVSTTHKMKDALLGTGFYYCQGISIEKEMRIFQKVNKEARGVRRPGSAAMDLAYVACGRYDGFWEAKLSPWDVAAGYLLVEEAGGRVTNYAGKKTDIYEGFCLASNRKIHPSLVKLIK